MKAAIYLRISHDPGGKAAGVRRQEGGEGLPDGDLEQAQG
jgi:hypothetical protein